MTSTGTKIRIAVMSKPLDNWRSGSGHHLDELMRHVLDLADGSMEFTFVHYKTSDNPIYSRVRELIIPRNPFTSSRLLKKENFDIIHYSPLSVFAPVWNIRAKKTATVHGIEEVLYPQGYSLIQRLHDTKIQPMYMRAMDGIATVSETSKRYFVDHYRIPEDRIFITTNGLGEKYRVLDNKEKTSETQQAPVKKYILHISKYSMRKNPLGIFRGFASFIRDTKRDWQLVCAGSGWDGAEARQAAVDAGIGDRYIAPGFISEETAVSLLNGAAVFLFPSFAEGFGMPNIEAMACGCPVVTSGIFAIPEIVGDAACIVDKPDDYREIARALAKIVNDEEYKKTLVERGFERIIKYNWDDSARSLLAYWKSLVR